MARRTPKTMTPPDRPLPPAPPVQPPTLPGDPGASDAPPSGVPGPGETGGPLNQGRTPGRAPDGPALARESAAQVFARLKSLAECGDPKVELAAIKEILAWAWGKSQPQDREGDLSLAELARLLARAAGEAPEEPEAEAPAGPGSGAGSGRKPREPAQAQSAVQGVPGQVPGPAESGSEPGTSPAPGPETPALKLVRTRRKTRGA